MVYALGHLSGAHINPAVTLAFWSVRRFPAGEVLPVRPGPVRRRGREPRRSSEPRSGPVGHLGATLPTVSIGAAFLIEWLLSFVLMFVIMAVATDERVVRWLRGARRRAHGRLLRADGRSADRRAA